MKRIIAVLAVALLFAWAVPIPAQDITTQLSKFLVDLRAGVLGVAQPITAVTLTGGTLTTTATPVLTGTVTWNGAGTTHKGIRLVVTDTASAAGSLPVEILGGAAGATNLFSVSNDGTVGVVALNLGPTTGNTTRGSQSIANNLVTINMATATGTGTGTITSPTTAIPAGSLVFGVTCRVTTILAGAGLTTWSIGDGTDVDRWGTAKAIAAGTTSGGADFTITTPPFYAAATSLVITAAAGVLSTGVLACTVHYVSFTPQAGS